MSRWYTAQEVVASTHLKQKKVHIKVLIMEWLSTIYVSSCRYLVLFARNHSNEPGAVPAARRPPERKTIAAHL